MASALAASDAGMPDAENARVQGVAVKTIRRWRREYQRRGKPRGQAHLLANCPRCDEGTLDEASYAELLGWYLGDGYISTERRGLLALHIYNDKRYVDLNSRIAELMRAVKPNSRPHTRLVPGCVITTVSWRHWACLFPHPADFLRGLFHSDGCRVNNWATRIVAGEQKRYDYPRWQFSNMSEDIMRWCGEALDLLDVPWRRTSRKILSVSTRAGVARLDELIGPKT